MNWRLLRLYWLVLGGYVLCAFRLWQGVVSGDILTASGAILFAAGLSVAWWPQLKGMAPGLLLIGWGIGNMFRGLHRGGYIGIDLHPVARLCIVSIGILLLVWDFYITIRGERKRANGDKAEPPL